MSTVQKWLTGLLVLGAAYLAFNNPNGVYKTSQAIRNVVGGTETDIITGGKG